MSDDVDVLKKASFVTSSIVRSGILRCLQVKEYATPGEIARLLGKHLPTVSRALSELRREGLVNFVEHERSRSRLYFLTEEGKRVVVVISRLGGGEVGPGDAVY